MSSDRPFEAHPDLADLELVAEAQRGHPVDAAAVDVRAVGAAQVLDVPAPSAVGQDGVVGRGERVIDDDRVVDVAPEWRDDVETEGLPGGRLAAWRLEDDEAARSGAGFA